MSNSRIIISDVHGCYKTLLALVEQLPKDIPLTFAGDNCDRGEDSKSVIEFVKNNKYDCVMGNHEKMMIDELTFRTLENGKVVPSVSFMEGIWLMNGGDTTLDSYLLPGGYHDIETLKKHKEWMASLPYILEYPELKNVDGDYLIVTHSTAAAVWNVYDKQHPMFIDNVLWERTHTPAKIKGVYNVFGHTPQKHEPRILKHSANIDGGVYANPKYYGKLFALQFPEMIVYSQDRV